MAVAAATRNYSATVTTTGDAVHTAEPAAVKSQPMSSVKSSSRGRRRMVVADWISVKSVVCCVLAAFNGWFFMHVCYGIHQQQQQDGQHQGIANNEDHKGFYSKDSAVGTLSGGGSGNLEGTCFGGDNGESCSGLEGPARLVRLEGVQVSL